jgi:2-polyprenyl-3-methyl-5-hydroxy-6-metoxy-1,4-benzoquinol methylase
MAENVRNSDYKERLYEHYLTHQALPNDREIQSALAQRAPYLRRLIANWVPADRDTRVLDLGCGYGAIMHFLREAGYKNVTGVDTSPEQVRAAQHLGLEDAHCDEIYPFLKQIQDHTYDVVIAFDILEHLTKPELLQLGDEVHRVLRCGGRFILHAPNGEAVFSGTVLHGDLTHELAFTRGSIRQFAGACSFKVISVREDVPIIHGFLSLLRFLLWHSGTFPLRLLEAAETGGGLLDKPLSQNLLAILER